MCIQTVGNVAKRDFLVSRIFLLADLYQLCNLGLFFYKISNKNLLLRERRSKWNQIGFEWSLFEWSFQNYGMSNSPVVDIIKKLKNL